MAGIAVGRGPLPLKELLDLGIQILDAQGECFVSWLGSAQRYCTPGNRDSKNI
jgi:hypothetical protein